MKKADQLITLLFLTAAALLTSVAELRAPTTLTMLDVGQGDALLLQTASGHRILIDTGPTSSLTDSLGRELPFWDQNIDLLILSHPHLDHIASAAEVVRRYNIPVVYLPDTDTGSRVIAELAYTSAEIVYATQGDVITLLNTNHNPILQLITLWPDTTSPVAHSENKNNSSVVSLVRGNSANPTILLTGDAEKEVERELLMRPINLNADILKVGHHGSRTSTTQAFLSRINPSRVLISAGADNKFGHPHPETIQKLNKANVSYQLTAQDGTIHIPLTP